MDQPFNFPIPEVDWQVLAPYAVLTIFGILGLIAEMLRPKHRNDLLVVLTLGGFALSIESGCPASPLGSTSSRAVSTDASATVDPPAESAPSMPHGPRVRAGAIADSGLDGLQNPNSRAKRSRWNAWLPYSASSARARFR